MIKSVGINFDQFGFSTFLNCQIVHGCQLKLHWTLETFMGSLKNASCISELLDRILKKGQFYQRHFFITSQCSDIYAAKIWSKVESARIFRINLCTFECLDAWYEKGNYLSFQFWKRLDMASIVALSMYRSLLSLKLRMMTKKRPKLCFSTFQKSWWTKCSILVSISCWKVCICFVGWMG